MGVSDKIHGGAMAEPIALLRMTRTFGTLQRNFGSRRACQGGFEKARSSPDSVLQVPTLSAKTKNMPLSIDCCNRLRPRPSPHKSVGRLLGLSPSKTKPARVTSLCAASWSIKWTRGSRPRAHFQFPQRHLSTRHWCSESFVSCPCWVLRRSGGESPSGGVI